jgi:hypothetical protein
MKNDKPKLPTSNKGRFPDPDRPGGFGAYGAPIVYALEDNAGHWWLESCEMDCRRATPEEVTRFKSYHEWAGYRAGGGQ